MVKVFTPNKNGKIEFTKKELEKLLDEVWRDGYNSNNNYYWHSPYWWSTTCTTTPSYISVSANDISTATIPSSENITLTSDEIKINIGE